MKKVFEFMKGFDDPELPDGAWGEMLQNAVRQYNAENHTNYNPFETWLRYLEWRSTN